MCMQPKETLEDTEVKQKPVFAWDSVSESNAKWALCSTILQSTTSEIKRHHAIHLDIQKLCYCCELSYLLMTNLGFQNQSGQK